MYASLTAIHSFRVNSLKSANNHCLTSLLPQWECQFCDISRKCQMAWRKRRKTENILQNKQGGIFLEINNLTVPQPGPQIVLGSSNSHCSSCSATQPPLLLPIPRCFKKITWNFLNDGFSMKTKPMAGKAGMKSPVAASTIAVPYLIS